MHTVNLVARRNAFYVFDFVVITGALYLEGFACIKGSALVTLVLVWRVVRIVHGLATSIELHHQRQSQKVGT